MRFIYCTLILPIAILTACGPTEQEQAQQEDRQRELQQQTTSNLPYNFRMEMDSVLTHYLDLKDAFLESDPELTRENARELSAFTYNVIDDVLDAEDQGLWLGIARIIRTETGNLLDEDEVGNQHIYFNRISNAVIQIADSFNPVEYPLYHQQCDPESGRELNWLSRSEDIRNPYQDEGMENCGEIIEVF